MGWEHIPWYTLTDDFHTDFGAYEWHGTRAIQTRLYREGIPAPTGREVWHRPVLKRMVLSDTYKPHTYEEAMELVPKR